MVRRTGTSLFLLPPSSLPLPATFAGLGLGSCSQRAHPPNHAQRELRAAVQRPAWRSPQVHRLVQSRHLVVWQEVVDGNKVLLELLLKQVHPEGL